MQHSWKWFLYYRTQNVNRSAKTDDTPRRKRAKVDDRAVHLYIPLCMVKTVFHMVETWSC